MNLFLLALVGKVCCFCFSRKEEIERTLRERPHRKNGFVLRCWRLGDVVGLGGTVLLKIIDWCCSVPISLVPSFPFHRPQSWFYLPKSGWTEADCTRVLLLNVNKSTDSPSGSSFYNYRRVET